MKAYWLLKTEPSEFSYEDLQKIVKAVWDGVTNNLALKHLRSMKKGDLAFIYHTGDEKSIVGLAEIVTNPYQDPKGNDPKIVVVDIKPKREFSKKVTLAEIKAKKEFASFDLVRISRLSVMPVEEILAELLITLTK